MGDAKIPEAKVVDGEYSTIRSKGDKAPLRKMFSVIARGFEQMFKTWNWTNFWLWLSGTTGMAILAGCCLFGFQSCERRDKMQQELRMIYVNKCALTPKQAEHAYPNDGNGTSGD